MRWVSLHDSHPSCRRFGTQVGGASEQEDCYEQETVLYQLEGEATVTVEGAEPALLSEGSCCVVGCAKRYTVKRPEGSIGMVIQNVPRGNKGVKRARDQ